MTTDSRLLEKQESLKQEILANKDKTLPTLILNTIDRMIRGISHRQQPLPWFYSAIVLTFISIIPTLLLTILFKEIKPWNEVGIQALEAVEMAVAGLIVTQALTGFVIAGIHDFLVNAIETVDHLADLQQWLTKFWVLAKPVRYALMGAFSWTAFSATWLSYAIGTFIGFGFIIAAILVGGLAGICFYYIFWILRLTRHLGHYQYALYDIDPVHSEVISRLAQMLNNYIYSGAVFFAVFSLIIASMKESVAVQVGIVVLLICWGTLTAQFVANQGALGKIVSNAKWKTLNEIQAEIRALRMGGKLTEKETTDAINRLIDLHERVRNTQNSALDLRAALNFLNQLMLPLLGFLLANLEKVLKLFLK